jgi:hypothetical protein
MELKTRSVVDFFDDFHARLSDFKSRCYNNGIHVPGQDVHSLDDIIKQQKPKTDRTLSSFVSTDQALRNTKARTQQMKLALN